MKKHLHRTFLILCLVFITSCSEIGEKKQKRIVRGIGSGCKIQLEELKDFFEKNIESKINCLEEQLTLAIKFLRNDKPGTLPLKELTDFLIKQPNIKDPVKTTKALRAVFEIKYILLGGSKGHIVEADLKNLFHFIRMFNNHAVKIYKSFDNDNSTTLAIHNALRDNMGTSTTKVSEELLKLFVADREDEDGNTIIDKINLEEFIEYFRTETNSESIEKAKNIIPMKKFIVGGNESEKVLFLHTDLGVILNKMVPLIEVAFDLARMKKLAWKMDYASSPTKLKSFFLEKLLLSFESTMFYKGGNPEPIFSIDEVITALDAWKEQLGLDNIKNYKPLIQHARGIIHQKILSPGAVAENVCSNQSKVVRANCENFYAYDFEQLIAYGREMAIQGNLFADMYEYYEEYLNAKTRLSIDMSGYDLECADPSSDLCKLKTELKKKFIRITKDYRFFKGSEIAPYFISDTVHGELFKRNEVAVSEIGLIEFAIEKALRYVELAYPCNSEKLVTKMLNNIGMSNNADQRARLERKIKWCVEDNAASITNLQISTMVFEIKDVLADIGLLQYGREEKIGESVTLMSALFQYQADDNGMIDTAEATEFAIGILTTQSLSESIYDEMIGEKRCKDSLYLGKDNEYHVALDCYRDNIIDIFKNEAKAEDHFPNFFSYYELLDGAEKQDFLSVVEMFTRPCKADDTSKDIEDIDGDGDKDEPLMPIFMNIPMSQNDMIGIVGGIYNIETTFSRWDKNGNNIMDKDEVDLAFNIYDTAISGIVDEMVNKKNKKWIKDLVYGNFLKGIRKNIFYYLIKYGKAPGLGKIEDAPGSTGVARFYNWAKDLGKLIGELIKGKTPIAKRIDIAKILRTLAVTSKTPTTNQFSCQQIFCDRGGVSPKCQDTKNNLSFR